MSKRVLVTGGAGYLGGRLAGHLSRPAAYEVRIASRSEGFDLFSEESLDRHCAGVDSVVHLAAPNEIVSLAQPGEAVRVTVIGTVNLLAAAQRAGVKRVIFLSTAHVYGAPLVGVITEQTLPRPCHPYAIAHRCAEDFVLALNQRPGVEGVVVRLSNALGPPHSPAVDRWTLVTNDLCRQAAQYQRLTLNTPGLQWRDFITMRDFCRAIEHLLEIPRIGDGLYNLGGSECLQIRELSERIAARHADLFGVRPAIVRPPHTVGSEPASLDFRSDKLKSTGFSLVGRIDDEIDGTLQFCREHFT